MIDFCINNISIILFLPVWFSFIIMLNNLSNFSHSRKITSILTLVCSLICIFFSSNFIVYFINNPISKIEYNYNWLNCGDFTIYLGILLDRIGAVFILLLSIISFCIQLFSSIYMKEQKSFHKFFIYLNIFNFSMFGFILSSNLIQSFICLELVSVLSYLLIGFLSDREQVSRNAQNVIIINKFADLFLLFSILILIFLSRSFIQNETCQSLIYSELPYLAQNLDAILNDSIYYLICLLMAIACFIKSAQIPLQTWLTKAMVAPSPVSALLHAATMIACGVFLLARLLPFLSFSQLILQTIAIVGIISAISCAIFACLQTEIKKILALSTSSNLGIMFMSLALFSSCSLTMFYLVIHAFSKALLFLCFALITLKIVSKEKNFLKLNYLCGTISLSGLFFSGLLSKDAVLNLLVLNGHNIFLIAFFISSIFTSFYLFRSYFLLSDQNFIEKNTKITRLHSCIYLTSISILLIPTIFLSFIIFKPFDKFINFPTNSQCALPFIDDKISYIVNNYSWINTICSIVLLLCCIFGLYFAYIFVKNKTIQTLKETIFFQLLYNQLFIDNILSFISKIYSKVAIITKITDALIENFYILLSLITKFIANIETKKENGKNLQQRLIWSINIITILLLLNLLYNCFGGHKI